MTVQAIQADLLTALASCWPEPAPPEHEQPECPPKRGPAPETTVLVFGGNSAGVASGRLQRAVCEQFPDGFQAIHQQLKDLPDWDPNCWPQDHQGELYVAQTRAGPWLVSCVVFPRDACHEFEHTETSFREALALAVQLADGGDVRVVSHALGSFTGHPAPQRFAESMARGLEQFILDYYGT